MRQRLGNLDEGSPRIHVTDRLINECAAAARATTDQPESQRQASGAQLTEGAHHMPLVLVEIGVRDVYALDLALTGSPIATWAGRAEFLGDAMRDDAHVRQPAAVTLDDIGRITREEQRATCPFQ